MTQHINIMVCVNDHYFSLGLELLVNDYFTRQGWSTTFLPPDRTQEADVVVLNNNEICSTQFCPRGGSARRRRVITLRQTRRIIRNRQLDCLSDYGTLLPHDRVPQIEELLARVIASYQTPDDNFTVCPRCEQVLTPRERQVLAAIHACKPPYLVAKHLGISSRTVSTHKRASMRKLGFQSNKELYQWLHLGGLEHEIRGRIDEGCPRPAMITTRQ